jgi:hypothetical protein
MAVFDMQIKDNRGKSIGWKVIQAPNKTYIRTHKSKYLGSDRYIGKIENRKAAPEEKPYAFRDDEQETDMQKQRRADREDEEYIKPKTKLQQMMFGGN